MDISATSTDATTDTRESSKRPPNQRRSRRSKAPSDALERGERQGSPAGQAARTDRLRLLATRE